MHNTVIRARSLYFTVHDPTNKLKIKKLTNQLLFYFLLRHFMQLSSNDTFPGKNTKKSMKYVKLSPVIFSFSQLEHPSIFFFSSTRLNNTCHDPSTGGYSECVLTKEPICLYSGHLSYDMALWDHGDPGILIPIPTYSHSHL